MFRLLVGEPKKELIGRSFADAVPGSGECVSILDRVHRSGHAETFIGQAHFPSHPLYFSYVIWPVLAEGGNRVGLMVLVTETTLFHKQTIEMNEALMVGSVHQHELTESAGTLNTQLLDEILHRRQAEENLKTQALEIKASEQRYRGLINAIPQVVWTATPEGMLDFANTNWFESLGSELATFNRQGWPTLLHPDDRDRTMEAWTSGLQSASAFQVEHRLKDGSTGNFRWYLSRAAPIVMENGQIAKWFGTSTDIDDQKRAELAVFNKQKLESLGILAGGIAHDFNNLLAGILGGASLVADSLSSSHSLQPILGNMVQASERAAHLTRQMLAYAGKGRFVIEQIDLSELVRSTYSLVQGSIPNHVHLTFDLRPDLPQVNADSGQIQQVAMNLILNAAEAIHESKSGTVTVRTDSIHLSELEIEKTALTTGSLVPGEYVVLEVQDNGSGMEGATLARIFDPFFTTKFTGRGLGLSAVEGILRSQKGALEVRSVVGTGSTFRVYLPAAGAKLSIPKIPSQSGKTVTIGMILVVDDEEIVRRVSQKSLEKAGFEVRVAEGGQEALRILESKAANSISLIVLDLSMPGMSGKQAMRQIRALGIQVPILICSGFSEDEISQEFTGFDIAGFIQKPFTARSLADRVSKIISNSNLRIAN